MARKKRAKKGVARLLEISGEKWGMLVLAGALSVLSTLLQFAPFVAVYCIIEELLRNAANVAASDMGRIRFWGVFALLSLLLSLLSLYVSVVVSHVAAYRILYNLRLSLAKHLAGLPMGFHTENASGAIKKILEFNVEKIEQFVAHQLGDFVAALALPAIMLPAMVYLDWRLALAAAVPIAAAFLLQGLVFYTDKSKKEMDGYHAALETMSATGVEFVRGMPSVKVFGLTVKSFMRFSAAIEDLRRRTTGMAAVYRRPMALFAAVLSSILTFVLPAGVFILGGDPSDSAFALTLLLFLTLAPGLSLPVLKLLYLGSDLRQVTVGVERIDGLLAEKNMPEPETPEPCKGYAVSFENVSFVYGGGGCGSDGKEAARREYALRNVSFTAREGAVTALVGPSGGGKSTVANLIARFWDVESGAIRIGGADVRNMGTEKLMETVSFVFQGVHLFYDTIAENIRMGRRDATDEDIRRAARLACCHKFIEALPEGYETKIGHGGTSLSGGEAQRIAIARAIVKNAPVLVLDEATAFADPENEANIQQGLAALMRGRTVIVIAHRLNTIREADAILVLNEGEIAERGNHESLLAAKGIYARMWAVYADAGSWHLEGGRARGGAAEQGAGRKSNGEAFA